MAAKTVRPLWLLVLMLN